VRRPSGDGTVFADIPGLIAGAAQGAGLGHDFLRHIQRTRLLIHLVDASSDDVVRDLAVVEQELEAYGHGLADRPRLVALNKVELLLDEELDALRGAAEAHCGHPVLAISAAAAIRLDQLLAAVWRELGIERQEGYPRAAG
jgi:GTP-binding protein